MGLRSWTLCALVVGLTVLLPLTVLLRLSFTGRGHGGTRRVRLHLRDKPRTVLGFGVRWLVLLLAQALAVASVLVVANRQFIFYQEWSDVFGGRDQGAQVATAGPALAADQPTDPPPGPPADVTHDTAPTVPLPQGTATPSGATLVRLAVDGHASGVRWDVLVWLPPEYFAAGNETKAFPVLYFLSGSPGTPDGLYNQFNFDRAASDAIRQGHVRPFVAVLPQVMTHPPHDTECLDIPNGPKSETWLATDVPGAVKQTVRVTHDPAQWSAVGYSTGGLCATNLLLRHRDKFGAAASLGGYFHPWAAKGEPDLFGGSEEFRRSVTPLWQFQNTPPTPTKLLIVSSTRDRASWDGPGPFDGDSRAMIEAAARWPGTAKIVLEKGGHDFGTYVPTLPLALQWLGQANSL